MKKMGHVEYGCYEKNGKFRCFIEINVSPGIIEFVSKKYYDDVEQARLDAELAYYALSSKQIDPKVHAQAGRVAGERKP